MKKETLERREKISSKLEGIAKLFGEIIKEMGGVREVNGVKHLSLGSKSSYSIVSPGKSITARFPALGKEFSITILEE